MYNYTAYGLTISSELALPELEIISTNDEPDVMVRFGSVPEKLENATVQRPRFQAAQGEFLLHLKDVARFYVQNGRNVTINPLADSEANTSAIRLYLLGSVFGALMQQRGILVLHGAFLVIHGKGVLLTGKSTAGKSTLAAALHQKGYAILTDDVCAVTLDDSQTPYAAPGFPSIKLWRDAAEMLNTDISGLKPILEDWQKYRVAVNHYHSDIARFDTVYILDSHDSPDIRLEPVTGMNKLNALIKNTYRHHFLHGQGLKSLHFKQCAAVASKVSVYRMVRPNTGMSLDVLANTVIENIVRGTE